MFGFIFLGLTYILGGLFSDSYNFKTAFFGLLQIITLFFTYFCFYYTVDWKRVTKDGFNTFIHSPSATSVQVQTFPYSPDLLSVSKESVEAELSKSGFSLAIPEIKEDCVDEMLVNLSTDNLETLCKAMTKKANTVIPISSQLYTEENNDDNSNSQFKF